MGRDWYWSGGSSKKPAETEMRVTRGIKREKGKENQSPPPGCMTGVLQLFDFHQFQFPITNPPCFKPNSSIPLQQDPTFVEGVAAPRNSLESDDEGITMETPSSMSTELKFHDTVEIKAVATRRIDEVSCSDSSSSPGPKTPSLVARLMGLDILPDSSPSPSPSSRSFSEKTNKKKKRNMRVFETETNGGSRSLPDTPRISSARRSDVDARFSLQINKENMNAEEFEYFSRIMARRREFISNGEDNYNNNISSPGHYARQIVKQVKESMSRRVGLDITNTTNNRVKSKEVDVVLLKSKKPKRLTKIGEESAASKSPRPRLCEIIEQVPLAPKPRSPPPSQPPPGPPQISMQSKFSAKQKPKLEKIEKCKKASCERFAQRREICAVRGSKTRRKKPQLGKEIATVSTESSVPLTSLSHDDQIQAPKPSCSSRTWSDRHTDKRNDRTCNDFGEEFRYVSDILKCTGINKDTMVSFARWYSPSHPLDPSIFTLLECSNHMRSGSLQHRCNRRLIFSLMDELLSNIIKPYINMKPWIKQQHESLRRGMHGDTLLQCLCLEITRFPALDCQTLEDIDSLIDKDLPDAKMRRLPMFEETESIVFEIEQDILDSLIHETADDVIHHMRIHVTRCR